MDGVPIKTVLIAGPTASGKSALALALARSLGGVVINADALQVYADLRVLTARPSAEEEAAAPHRIYGHVAGAEPYAVGRWLAEVTREIESAACAGAVPIIVGGTGLYFEALTSGLAVVPDIPAEVRACWRAAPAADLHAELARRDPIMAARLRPSDPQRLMRALEVIDATGRSLADWQRDTAPGPVDPADALRIALAPDRAALDRRIAARLAAMTAAGAREEAEALVARGLDPAAPVMKALGVAPLAAWARGEIEQEAALARTRLDTRRYAKRQSTWFRNRMQDWQHVPPEEALDAARAELVRRGVARGGLA
jgi:tRNA dimethylallyltransferase